MLPFANSLRFRLTLLVFFAVLPAMGLIISNGAEDRRHSRIDAQEDALRLASLVSLETEQVIEMTRQLLSSLAQFPAVKERDTNNCSFLLENINRIHSFYMALLVVDPAGEVVCSSLKGQDRINVADRDYVRRALETRDFAISDFIVGRLTGKPSLGFAHPIIDQTQQIQGVVIASIDLSWLVRIASGVALPAGSAMTIIDSKGMALARWPDPEKWIGRAAAETEIGKIVLAETAGVADAVGMDGVPRLYGFRPLLPGRQAGFVYVGIPRETAYAVANQVLIRNLIALGAVLVLGLLAAIFFGQVFIMRGVTDLVNASKQLAAGNLEARTSMPSTSGEIGQLAAAFDHMASALQQRENDRKQAEEKIRRNADRSEFLSDISEEFIRAGLDYAPVLSTIAQRAREWFGDTCFIHLLTEEGKLDEVSAAYAPRPERRNFVNGLSLFMSDSGQAFLDMVVRRGHPLLVSREDPQCVLPLPLERLDCHSIIIVPMRADEQVIGTLTMIRDQPNLPHTTEDESFLQYIADRAAMSVANVQLVQTIHRLNAELEERVKRRTAQLLAANKELEAFAYSVSHDLRTPLRAIDGFSRLLLEKYGNALDSKGSHYLDRTRAAAQRMGELIDDLLQLSRLTRAEMKNVTVDLSAIAREFETHLRESQPHRAVEFVIQDGLVVLGDESLLRAALGNLLGNSWKFTGKKDHALIEFGMKTQHDESVFFVRDNGAGFQMEYVDKLFGAFQRLHSISEFPGTGIGLAIVQRVIHRHAGSVWAEGAEGRGATFYFKFSRRGEV